HAGLRATGQFGKAIVEYVIDLPATRGAEGVEVITSSEPSLTVRRERIPPAKFNYSLPNGSGWNTSHGSLLRWGNSEGNENPAVASFCGYLARLRVYDLSIAALRSESAVGQNGVLDQNGANLASVIDWLQNREPEMFDLVEHAV